MLRRPIAAALALGGAAVLAACSSSGAQPAPIPTPGASIGTPLDHALPAKLLSLPLVDQFGQPRPLSSFRGKVIVISDTMTLCQEACPLDTADVVQTARAVQKAGLGDYVQFLSITVDPQRDTPPQINAYRKLFADPPADWAVLTGPVAAVNTLWNTLGVYRKKVPQDTPPPKNWRTGQVLTYDIEHSDEVFFVNDTFHDRFVLEGTPALGSASDIPGELRRFMDAEGLKNVLHPAKTAWTEAQALEIISWLLGRRIAA